MRRYKKGFTLVEIIISLAILGIISSTIFVIVSKSNDNNKLSKEKQEAKLAAQSIMEKITSQKNIKKIKIDDNVWIKGEKAPYEIEGVVDEYKISGKIEHIKKENDEIYKNIKSDMYINVQNDTVKFFFRECDVESIKNKEENFSDPNGIKLQKVKAIKIYQRPEYFYQNILIRGIEITFQNTNYNYSVLSVYNGSCYNDYCEESKVIRGQEKSTFMFGKTVTGGPIGIEIRDTNIPIYIENNVPSKHIQIFNYIDKKDINTKQNLEKYLDSFNNEKNYKVINDTKSDSNNGYNAESLYVIDINVSKGEKKLQSITGSYLEGED